MVRVRVRVKETQNPRQMTHFVLTGIPMQSPLQQSPNQPIGPLACIQQKSLIGTVFPRSNALSPFSCECYGTFVL